MTDEAPDTAPQGRKTGRADGRRDWRIPDEMWERLKPLTPAPPPKALKSRDC